jgi:hypothetical protein
MAKTSAPAPKAQVSKSPDLQHNGPVFSTRHRAIKAAVWKNQSDTGDFYNVTVSRGYKDGETWKDSSSFGYDDVLIVAELLRTCHGFISREMAKGNGEGRD